MQASIPFRNGRILRALTAALFTAAVSPLVAQNYDATGTIQYTKRFGGDTVVVEVEWFYDRSAPSLTFGDPRTIWTGDPVPDGSDGSDGLFHIPNGDMIVANWQGSTFVKLDPNETDDVLEGPVPGGFPFHTLLHPNLDDFLVAPAFGTYGCSSDGVNADIACFGVNDHTPLTAQTLCIAPTESESGDELQPHTFIADENLNLFVIFSNGEIDIQFGGGGFASFELGDTDSGFCDPDMDMTRLIPQEIPSAHSVSWSPFLSNANPGPDGVSPASANSGLVEPHSDFITFANSRFGHIRVMNPGTDSATAEVMSEVDMTSEAACAMLLPPGEHEFDQGAVTGSGIALVADEHTPYLALLDYSRNQNGTIRDPENMVCLVAHLEDGIDDIAPLTGLGAKEFFGPGDDGPMPLNAGHSGAYYERRTAGQGFFAEITQDDLAAPAKAGSKTDQAQNSGFAFLSWFTYTPGDSSDPNEQHWYTLQGPYSGDRAFLAITETLGGEFDDNDPVENDQVGTATLVMFDCDVGEVTYNFDDGRQGVIPIERVIPGSGKACEALVAASPQTQDINAGMDGAWYESENAGQGFFLDADPAQGISGRSAAGSGFLFLSWFTFGNNTDSGLQWFTAQGGYNDSVATLDIYETTGGSFDDTDPVSNEKVGTIDIDFDDCENADLAYAFDGGPSGDMDLTRVVPGAGDLCNTLAAEN